MSFSSAALRKNARVARILSTEIFPLFHQSLAHSNERTFCHVKGSKAGVCKSPPGLSSPPCHPKFASWQNIAAESAEELSRQRSKFSSCSASCSDLESASHHDPGFGDFTFQLKGFDDNPELLTHAANLAITVGESALRCFLSGRDSDVGISEHGGRPTVNTGHSDVVSTHGFDGEDLMSFLSECFESGPEGLFANKIHFPCAAPAFQCFFEKKCSKELRSHLQAHALSSLKEKVIFPAFIDFCNENYPSEMKRFQGQLTSSDMRSPQTVYASARSLKRKIVYHHGPTNSGKTYNALQRFLQVSNGIYCGPLRLLALEIYDTANAKGVLCTLVTGQERKEIPLASHVACTVEMVDLQQVWKVAVIDEVQLLNDESRGWAWTRALLGVQAEELHVCGDPSARGFIRSMCLVTGDDFEEFSYERFKPLAVDPNSLKGDFRNVQSGDCIITFSRRQIFEIKRAVERATRKRCCVVYGALPPETRAQQAKLFNEPGNEFDILVASDAVGMGLNLNIRRVVFHTLEKFNGEGQLPIPPPLIKQIAGRAGRRGSLYPEGLVTTFLSSDLPRLYSCLGEPFPESCCAGLFPSCEQLQAFAGHMPNAKFSQLLESFMQMSQVDRYYFVCQNMALKRLADIIDTIDNLTLEERLTFCFSPVNGRNPKSVGALLQYAKLYSQRSPLQLLVGKPSLNPHIDFQLMHLEEKYELLSLYLWLSQHFPAEYFPQIDEAQNMSLDIASTLGESLADLSV